MRMGWRWEKRHCGGGLRSGGGPHDNNKAKKGDTSNEVKKGTFLTRFDTIGFVPCQRKVEMSGFSPGRNVRFHGFLQG